MDFLRDEIVDPPAKSGEDGNDGGAQSEDGNDGDFDWDQDQADTEDLSDDLFADLANEINAAADEFTGAPFIRKVKADKLRCSCHVIQLVFKDAYMADDLVKDIIDALDGYSSACSKSTLMMEAHKHKARSVPPLLSSTRWLYAFMVLSYAEAHHDAILETAKAYGYDLKFAGVDALVTEAKNVIAPLWFLQLNLQSRQPTMSGLVLGILACLEYYADLSSLGGDYVEFADATMKGLKDRFLDILPVDGLKPANPIPLAAACLDPYQVDALDKYDIRTLSIDALEEYMKLWRQDRYGSAQPANQVTQPSSKWLKIIPAASSTPNSSQAPAASSREALLFDQELRKFISIVRGAGQLETESERQETDFEDYRVHRFWEKQEKCLREAAVSILLRDTSTAEAERSFSYALSLGVNRRGHMSASTVATMVKCKFIPPFLNFATSKRK